ncbi:MAG: hypothetical protein LBR65_02830 [Culturomica sp.]|nr:hypothetical protein [Culturomica sp.]
MSLVYPDAPVYCPSGTLSPQRLSTACRSLESDIPHSLRSLVKQNGFRSLRQAKTTIVAPDNRSEGSIHLRSGEVI